MFEQCRRFPGHSNHISFEHLPSLADDWFRLCSFITGNAFR